MTNCPSQVLKNVSPPLLLYEVQQSRSVKSKKKKLYNPIIIPFSFSFYYTFSIFFLIFKFNSSIVMEWRTAIIHTTTPSSLLHTFNHFTLLFSFKILNVNKKDEHYHAQQLPLLSLSLHSLYNHCLFLFVMPGQHRGASFFFLSSYFSFLFQILDTNCLHFALI